MCIGRPKFLLSVRGRYATSEVTALFPQRSGFPQCAGLCQGCRAVVKLSKGGGSVDWSLWNLWICSKPRSIGRWCSPFHSSFHTVVILLIFHAEAPKGWCCNANVASAARRGHPSYRNTLQSVFRAARAAKFHNIIHVFDVNYLNLSIHDYYPVSTLMPCCGPSPSAAPFDNKHYYYHPLYPARHPGRGPSPSAAPLPPVFHSNILTHHYDGSGARGKLGTCARGTGVGLIHPRPCRLPSTPSAVTVASSKKESQRRNRGAGGRNGSHLLNRYRNRKRKGRRKSKRPSTRTQSNRDQSQPHAHIGSGGLCSWKMRNDRSESRWKWYRAVRVGQAAVPGPRTQSQPTEVSLEAAAASLERWARRRGWTAPESLRDSQGTTVKPALVVEEPSGGAPLGRPKPAKKRKRANKNSWSELRT